MKVLITGGGGFIGSHLVDSQLAQGHFVRTVDLSTERLRHVESHPRLELIAGNIKDRTLIDRMVDSIDLVYHLASAHLDIQLSENEYRETNVEATKNLLVAAQEAGVKRMVHCSTNGVVGKILRPPVDETATCRPTNAYERTKLLGEETARDFAEATGFSVVIVRPAWVYGPRCPRTRKLMDNIRKGRFPMFGDGQTLRHPVFVTDAVKGLELCAERTIGPGAVYFIAGEQPVTIENLIKTIAEVQDVRTPTLRFPLALGKILGYGLQLAFRPFGKQPPFSRRSIDFYLKHNAYDISKAKQELGYQPSTDLRRGLEKTLEWQANDCQSFYIKA